MIIKYQLGKLPSNIVDQYNQFQKRKVTVKQPKQATQLSTLCKMLKVAVGTVVLALPDGFRQVYVLGGVLTLIICGLLQLYSWNLLIDVIEEKDKLNKPEPKKQTKKIIELNVIDDDVDKLEEEGDQLESSMIQDNSQNEPIVPQIIPTINPLRQRIIYSKMNMIGVMKLLNPDNKKMIIFTQVTTLILMFGQAVTLIIFFNQTLKEILSQSYSEVGNQIAFAMASIILIMLFSFIKSMEKLAILTNCGSYLVFIVMYFFSSVCLYQIKTNSSASVNPSVNYGINWQQVPFFFGISLFSYDINGMLTEIREEMKEPAFFRRNLAQSMFICCVIYVSFGFLGYQAYGVAVDTLITVNLTDTLDTIGVGVRSAFQALQMFYALSMLLTVILQNVVSIRLLEDLPKECCPAQVDVNAFEQKLPLRQNIYIRLFIRFLYISACVITGTYLQNFSVVISVLGSITSVAIGFFMPYYLYTQVFTNAHIARKIFNFCVLMLGVVAGIMGVISLWVKY